ncbi:MAG TPA: hypothetical protein PLY31_09340 [Tenuifilaceae bacterium]|nr:hypothetical protein [Tenuifilaceae bacterium]
MRKAILLIVGIGLNAFMCMAQTRGAAEGEIYYSTSTYIDDQAI